MKKFLGLVLLLSASIITLINLGKVVAYEWDDIKVEMNNLSDYLDQRYDEAIEVIDERVAVIFD